MTEIERTFQVYPRSIEVGGGWQLRLYENGREMGGGVFPPVPSSDPRVDIAYEDAYDEGLAWGNEGGVMANPGEYLPFMLLPLLPVKYVNPHVLRIGRFFTVQTDRGFTVCWDTAGYLLFPLTEGNDPQWLVFPSLQECIKWQTSVPIDWHPHWGA